MVIEVASRAKRQVIDITDEVARLLPSADGVVSVFVKHTTSAVTTADLDPGTDEDLLDALKAITPELQWRHPHDPEHAPDHLLASIVGPEVSVPFTDGKLQLGSWQRIILIEFDGPRQRSVKLTFLSTPANKK